MTAKHYTIITCNNKHPGGVFLPNASALPLARREARDAGWLTKRVYKGGKGGQTGADFCPECRDRMEDSA